MRVFQELGCENYSSRSSPSFGGNRGCAIVDAEKNYCSFKTYVEM